MTPKKINKYKTSFFDRIRLWFKNTKCHKCGNKLRRINNKKLIFDGHKTVASGRGVDVVHLNEYEVEIKYECNACGEIHDVNQLLSS